MTIPIFNAKENSSKGKGHGIADSTKKAMAEGRARSRVVDAYIKALDTNKFRNRGVPKPDPRESETELKRLSNEIDQASGVTKLLLIQERRNLENQIKSFSDEDEFNRIREAFVTIAKQFSIDRKISYESWRELGVPVRVLHAAGLYPSKVSQISSESLDSENLDNESLDT